MHLTENYLNNSVILYFLCVSVYVECYYRDEQPNAWLWTFVLDLSCSFGEVFEKSKAPVFRFSLHFFYLFCLWLSRLGSRVRKFGLGMCKGFLSYQDSKVSKSNKLHWLVEIKRKKVKWWFCFKLLPLSSSVLSGIEKSTQL